MSPFICRTCTDPSYGDVTFPFDGFHAGGVYSVKESVYAPYTRIFMDQATGGPTQWALSQGVEARVVKRSSKRPCAMMETVEDPRKSQVYVYLMATYKSMDIHKLPWLFRFFSFPVSPNYQTHDMNMDGVHFHSMPEWADHRPQWIIIIPIRTFGIHANTPPWPPSRTARAMGVGPYSFGLSTMASIDKLYHTRIQEWQERCKEPDFLPVQAELLNKHEEEDRKRQAEASSYGSQVSVQTTGTAKFSTRTNTFTPSNMVPILENETLDEPLGDSTSQRTRPPLRSSTLTNAPSGSSRTSPYPSVKPVSRTSFASLERDIASAEIRTPTDHAVSVKSPQHTQSRRGARWRSAKAVMARVVPTSLRKSSKDSA